MVFEEGPVRRILEGRLKQEQPIAGRILGEGPVRKRLRELRSPDIPLLFKGTISRVEQAIAEEKEAIDEYAELENQLRKEGDKAEADIVNEIRNDEMDHRVKFEQMLRRMKVREYPRGVI